MSRHYVTYFILVLLAACSTVDTDIIDPVDQIAGDAVTGDGTPQNPYMLSNPAHLDVFLRNRLDANYKLKNDIDLTSYIAENYSTEGWLPINNFVGVFDGGEFTISGVWINQPSIDNIGFFGLIGNESNSIAVTIEIKNLTLEIAASKSITGLSLVGGLIGNANDGVKVTNAHVVGADDESQVISMASGTDTAIGRSGGLIGGADRTTIIGCSSGIDVVSSGANRIGGLVGMLNGSTIDQSYASGDISGGTIRVGGLVGYANLDGTSITNSYATGNVIIATTDTDDIGGFIGASASAVSPITNCYTIGNIVIDATSVGSYGYFSGDGDGGTANFGSNAQTVLNGVGADLSSGVVSESGFTRLTIGSTTCTTFSAYNGSIWSCTNGSFPTLINNP